MRLRKAAFIATIAAAALGGGLAAAVPANASSPPICAANGVFSNGCLNRQGGGTANGTHILGWHNNGDPNNDFGYIWLRTYCGLGYVTTICPFNNSAFNQRYLGQKIYELAALNVNGKCVALLSSAVHSAILNNCGSYGSVFVRSSLSYLVSDGGTNTDGHLEWLEMETIGYQVQVTSFASTVWTSP